jgi:exonuclease SbcD
VSGLTKAVPEAEIMMISGNHDSAPRVNMFRSVLRRQRIHMIGTPPQRPEEHIEKVTLKDAFGNVNFYLLPFVKPVNVRSALLDDYPEEAAAISSYTDALRAAIRHMDVDESERNVLVAHQFVTGAKTSESENTYVGGLDNVDVDVFDPFDYVALGHLHSPQRVSRDTVRYCGTPLKYSVSEADQEKSVTVIELREKGTVDLRFLPLIPLRDLRKIRGTYQELTLRDTYQNTNTDDFLHITLTDEQDIPYAVDKLRNIYPNLIQLAYDNLRTRNTQELKATEDAVVLTPSDLFEQFFETQNNQPMSDDQRAYLQSVIEKIWEDAS